jgi:opacity protein-like surface antigen
MKKFLAIAAVLAFASAFGSVAVADDTVPGAYAQQDQSVMGVGRTMMQMGAQQRALTDAINRASGAAMSRSSAAGVNVDYQFGQSQSDQSWKAQRTVEEASVRGLVVGDCQGDNSDAQYRSQMNQNRKGYSPEVLISNKACETDHPTVNIGAVE